MASFNKVLLIGNLTRDPELRYTPKGTAVADIGLACNEKRTDQATGQVVEDVVFVDVTLWGKTAENVSKYLSKGSSCMIEGKLKLDQWEDNQTGQKRSKLKVVGLFVQFLGSPKGAGGGGGQHNQSRGGDNYDQSREGARSGRPQGQAPPQGHQSTPGGGDWNEDDDDIPF
jgi:single-strand DNA-binding protein